ncbi:MAG: hypothetical protein MJ237_01705 [bacterium]|nr:hypothetical protein [bacterium]
MSENSELGKLDEYFVKLKKTLNSQAVFSLGDKRYVNKQRIDDILCCIDASFPKKLKTFKSRFDRADANVKSYDIYQNLINNIRIKPLFGKDNYSINYTKAIKLIDDLEESINNDLIYIEKFYPAL